MVVETEGTFVGEWAKRRRFPLRTLDTRSRGRGGDTVSGVFLARAPELP